MYACTDGWMYMRVIDIIKVRARSHSFQLCICRAPAPIIIMHTQHVYCTCIYPCSVCWENESYVVQSTRVVPGLRENTYLKHLNMRFSTKSVRLTPNA